MEIRYVSLPIFGSWISIVGYIITEDRGKEPDIKEDK